MTPQITPPGEPPNPLAPQPTFRDTFYAYLQKLVTAFDEANVAFSWLASEFTQGGLGVRTSNFGHIDGSSSDQSARIQAALDYAETNGLADVVLSYPVSLGSTVYIPSNVTLRNPSGHTTTMLAGCHTAYRNKTTELVFDPSTRPGIAGAIIDANNVSDAYQGIFFEGAVKPSIVNPVLRNFTAIATGIAGAGHSGADGGDSAYNGYDDATGIVLTTYKTTSGGFRRTKEWYIENPVFEDCNRFVILTTHPDDSGSDGANFGKMTRVKGNQCTSIGIDMRFGEGNDFDMGRLETSDENCVALMHIGDTVTTINNVGTDGVMFTAYVRLADMTAGQTITQISVEGTNILNAAVPFNTDMDTTVDDLLTSANAGPSSYTFARSARRPALWIYAANGNKLPTGSTTIVVTTTATQIVASGDTADTSNVDYRGSAVTGLRDKFDNPEGHEGSDTIGILVTDRGGAEIVQPGGNGIINRIWYAPSVAILNSSPVSGHIRTNVLRASDQMTKFGGVTKFDNQAKFNALATFSSPVTLTSGFEIPDAIVTAGANASVQPVTLGDWSVSYVSRRFDCIKFGPLAYVTGRFLFTPTFTGSAIGNLRIILPSDVTPALLSGSIFSVDVLNLDFPSIPTGSLGAKLMVYGNNDYAQIGIVDNGVTRFVDMGDLTSGVQCDIRFAGWYPIDVG